MGKESEIKRLERYVEGLLERYTRLKSEQERLERDLKSEQDARRALQERLDGMAEERGEVSDRVSMLIERIERWEEELESGITEHNSETAAGEPYMAEEYSETEGSQVDDEQDEADKSGGVQGNLFSAKPDIV